MNSKTLKIRMVDFRNTCLFKINLGHSRFRYFNNCLYHTFCALKGNVYKTYAKDVCLIEKIIKVFLFFFVGGGVYISFMSTSL